MIWFCVLLMSSVPDLWNIGVTADFNKAESDVLREQPWVKTVGMRCVHVQNPSDVHKFRLLIPPGTALVLVCDPVAGTVYDTLVPDYGLTSDALEAIGKSPCWLRLDLVDNLMQLDASRQDLLADMILNPREPRLRDEIAFQVAHISPSHLKVMNLDVIKQNVDSLYAIDEDLGYVEIVDHGNPAVDTDYYSTLRYKILKNNITLKCEIPKEIYYWYVIHPRGTDETPAIIYDKFWREFLYYDNGATSYTETGKYPLLRDALDTVSYAWEVTEMGCGSGAVKAVNDWVNGVVKWGATSPRPIQPISIACDHDGNCGEFQDITWAGARTALIPTVGVLDVNEDHVWCTMWESKSYDSPTESAWRPDSGGAFDIDHGGSKYCSLIWGWRGDGLQTSRIEDHSKSCTLTVKALDDKGRSLSGLSVDVNSEGWQSSMMVKGYSGITDRNGVYTTTVGEGQNYYVKVHWNNMGKVLDSSEAAVGINLVAACTLSADFVPKGRDLSGIQMYTHFSVEEGIDTTFNLPLAGKNYLVFFNNYPEMGEALSGTVSIAGSSVTMSLDAEYDQGHCKTNSYEETISYSTIQFSPGKLTDFFVTDLEGINRLGVPEDERPYRYPFELKMSTFFSQEGASFAVSGAYKQIKLCIFDKVGRRIYAKEMQPTSSGNAFFEWKDKTQPSGVYFVRVESGSLALTRKLLLLK